MSTGDPEETEAAERDELRRDRHKERERDRRIKRANPGKAEKMRSMEVLTMLRRNSVKF